MDVITMRNRARRKSGVSSNDYTDANLLEDFNVAYYQLASIISELDENYFEEQKDKFNLLQNSGLYSLPTDAMKVKQIRLAYSTPSGPSDYRIARSYDPKQVHVVASDEEAATSTFPIYNVTNNYFRIKPTPTAAVSNGGQIYYIARPSALVNTGDVPVLPLQYHEIIAVYGAAQMAAKFQKWQKADRLQKQYDAVVLPLMQRVQDLADRDMGASTRFTSPLETPLANTVRELPDD